MIHRNTTAIDAVNAGRDTPDAFYHKSKLIATSRWKSIDSWRGYTEITPEPGFKLIDSDWMTSDWGDAVAAEHGETPTEERLKRLEREHGDIWVIYTPTSSVFSTGVDVLIRDPEHNPAEEPRRRRIAHKTYKIEYPDGSWAVQYHATKVVQYDAKTGKYTLDTGGWNTMTTSKRMNEHLPGGYRVYRKSWVMRVVTPELGDVELIDGMEV